MVGLVHPEAVVMAWMVEIKTSEAKLMKIAEVKMARWQCAGILSCKQRPSGS